MKKTILILILFLFKNNSNAQQNKSDELFKNNIENVALLCKTWGFLKYYHPNVAKGKFNWDNELLIILKKIENEKDNNVTSKIFLDWINSLGDIKECKSCKKENINEYFNKNFDLSWIQNNKIFSEELKVKLKFIEENRFQGENHYINTKNSDNIKTTNEIQYDNFEYLDKHHRLLGLFKYWNTVEYFFPYKYMTDQKWDDVLIEMIPKFSNAKNSIEYHLAMSETVIKLDDSHANFYTYEIHDFFGRKYLPINYKIIEDKVVVTSFRNDSLANMNDFKIGDIIETFDGYNARIEAEKRIKYINGSNKKTKYKNFDFFLFNGSTDSINLTIKRGDKLMKKSCKRYVLKDLEINIKKIITKNDKYKLLDNNIGYINMEHLELKDVEDLFNEFKKTKGLIIDLRNYPKINPNMIARRLINKEKEFAKLLKPNMKYPGYYTWMKPEIISPLKNDYYEGKVILLVNEETQSFAEYSTMIFQTGDNVTTLGSKTAAANGNVSRIEFIQYKSFISGLGVFYPDGTKTQRVGVKVDIEVNPTIEGLKNGKDEVMDKAIEFIIK